MCARSPEHEAEESTGPAAAVKAEPLPEPEDPMEDDIENPYED